MTSVPDGIEDGASDELSMFLQPLSLSKLGLLTESLTLIGGEWAQFGLFFSMLVQAD